MPTLVTPPLFWFYRSLHRRYFRQANVKHQLCRVSDAGTPSCLPRLLLTCTAGDRTPSWLPSFSLTARTASLSVRDLTSTLCSPTRPTPVTPTLVSTCTLSPFALRSTSPLAPATSPALTTPPFSWCFPMPPLLNQHRQGSRVYATNYNVLRVMSGMGGLAYSN